MTLHKSLILATTQDMRMHSLLVTRIKDRVMIGDIQLQDLVVSKVLGQELLPHVSAAIQLANEWKSTVAVVEIEYIFTDACHTNPSL